MLLKCVLYIQNGHAHTHTFSPGLFFTTTTSVSGQKAQRPVLSEEHDNTHNTHEHTYNRYCILSIEATYATQNAHNGERRDGNTHKRREEGNKGLWEMFHKEWWQVSELSLHQIAEQFYTMKHNNLFTSGIPLISRFHSFLFLSLPLSHTWSSLCIFLIFSLSLRPCFLPLFHFLYFRV